MRTSKLVRYVAAGAGAAVLALGAAKIYAAVTVAWPGSTTAIPDNATLTTTLTVDNTTVNNPGSIAPPWNITDLNVTFSILHTWDDDVFVRIASPVVAAVTIMQNCGGSGDNFTNTVIDDAGGPVAAGCAAATAAPFTGTFQALQGGGPAAQPPTVNATALAAFNGTNAFGTWTLTTTDDSAVCTGSLVSWSLTLDGAAPLPVELMDFNVQ